MEAAQSISPAHAAEGAEERQVTPLLHTISDACALLSISAATAYRMIDAGTLATVRIGRRRMVKAHSIKALAEHGTQQ
jgi:excisionase family DNA binding protein